jgi:DNA-binding MarR family transcriptional regulator
MKTSQMPQLDVRIPPMLDSTSLIQRAGFLLNRSAMDIRVLFCELLQPLGIDPRHFGVLSFISEGGASSQQRIAEQINCDRTTMVTVIDDLEKLRLARRTIDPDDRRKSIVCLTEKGKRVLERAGKVADEAERQYLAPLAPEERKQLKQMLQRLVLAKKS